MSFRFPVQLRLPGHPFSLVLLDRRGGGKRFVAMHLLLVRPLLLVAMPGAPSSVRRRTELKLEQSARQETGERCKDGPPSTFLRTFSRSMMEML